MSNFHFMERSTQMPANAQSESEMTGETLEDVFREAFTKFIKKNADPCKTDSQIIKTGEARWRRLPKYKKVEYIQRALNARKRRKQNNAKKRPCCTDRRHTFSGVPRDEDCTAGNSVVEYLLREIAEKYPKARATKRAARKRQRN